MATTGIFVPELVQHVPLTASKSGNGPTWTPNSLPNSDAAFIFTNDRCGIKQQAVANVHAYPAGTWRQTTTIKYTVNFWFKASTTSQGSWTWCDSQNLVLTLATESFYFVPNNPDTRRFATSSQTASNQIQPNAMWAFSVDDNRLSYTQPEWGDDKLVSSYYDFSDTNWHMVTVTANQNTVGFYVDSVLSGTNVTDVGNAATAREYVFDPAVLFFAIGCTGPNLAQGSAPSGTGIAKVQYWHDTVLSGTDITTLYNAM